MPGVEDFIREADPTPVVHNIPTIADRIRASDENDTPISGLNLRTIASAIRHKNSTTGQTVATALNSSENDYEASPGEAKG